MAIMAAPAATAIRRRQPAEAPAVKAMAPQAAVANVVAARERVSGDVRDGQVHSRNMSAGHARRDGLAPRSGAAALDRNADSGAS
jgi:hypothetical protein